MNIAIFASGEGTNAENIIQFLNKTQSEIHPVLVYTNKQEAGVLKRVQNSEVKPLFLEWKEVLNHPTELLAILKEYNIEGIVLAGVLKLSPGWLINNYPRRIINIHPALLPSETYGGKGMYGMTVHQKIFDNKESKTGITIHLVDKEYDKGQVLFTKSIDISTCNSPEEIARSVHELEYEYFPQVISNYFLNLE